MAEFAVSFDVRADVNWLYPALMLVGWLFFSALLVVPLVRSRRAREWGNVVLCGVMLTVALGVGGFIIPVQFWERWQAVRWAKSGDFEVVEGPVTDYQHSMTSPNWSASYSVGGVSFRSSNNPFNGCETPRVAPDGPIRPGAYLRIAHHGGRVLRVEERE